MENDGRIEVTAPRPHDEALERRQAHRRVGAPPCSHCRHAAPVPQVTGNQVHLVNRPPQHLRRRQRHVSVARSVEPVAPDAVLLIQAVWNGVKKGVRPERLMESRVEHGNVGNARHQLHRGTDAHQIRRIVKRRERHARLHRFDDRLLDPNALGEPLAPMDHPVTDRVNVVQAREDGMRSGGQVLNHQRQGRPMVGRLDGAGCLLAAGLVANAALGLADSFDDAGGRLLPRLTVRHAKQGILDAR